LSFSDFIFYLNNNLNFFLNQTKALVYLFEMSCKHFSPKNMFLALHPCQIAHNALSHRLKANGKEEVKCPQDSQPLVGLNQQVDS